MRKILKATAIEKGDHLYFTGEPCQRGHIAARDTVSGACVECHKINARTWIKRKRAEIIAKRTAAK